MKQVDTVEAPLALL